ncbi:MAG: enoyl-CoA hydratase/isomerase family protein [Pseudomonadota bacterium]
MSDLLYEVADGVGRLTFNRPDQRNALTFEMYEGLAEICANLPADGSVKALILEGAGDRAFAAGTDMTQFRAFAEPQDALDYEAKIDRVLEAVERCPVPTIAAITGACTGGGAGVAAACDIRIADERLKFGFPIARTLGNCLSIASLSRLSALMGAGRLREILFTARLIEAEEARTIGLVSEVLHDADEVRARATALAELLAGHAPLTLRAAKEGLRRLRVDGPGADGSDFVVETYMSADFKEGLEAFLAKRPPNWKGR